MPGYGGRRRAHGGYSTGDSNIGQLKDVLRETSESISVLELAKRANLNPEKTVSLAYELCKAGVLEKRSVDRSFSTETLVKVIPSGLAKIDTSLSVGQKSSGDVNSDGYDKFRLTKSADELFRENINKPENRKVWDALVEEASEPVWYKGMRFTTQDAFEGRVGGEWDSSRIEEKTQKRLRKKLANACNAIKGDGANCNPGLENFIFMLKESGVWENTMT